MARIEVTAEVTGNVWKIEAAVGDTVAADDVIMILESMKMEIPVGAPEDGVLTEVLVAEGDTVTVEFNGGRQYDYKSADVSGFVSSLNDVIAKGESVGRFVNTSIRSKSLQTVTV